MSGPYPKTYAGEVKWFRKMRRQKNDEIFIIIDPETNQHIGNVGIHHISKAHRKAEIGIMIGEKSYWGKGYGTDAVKTALKYCFKKLKLNKVSLTVFPKNKRAQKCYKKCGFKRIAYLKDDVFVRGKFQDALYMEVFAKDSTG